MLCFVSILCCFNKFVNHDGHRGYTAHALVRWRHPVASSEALDVLHRAMCPVSHRRIRMVIEIVVDLPAFFVAVDSLLPTIIAKYHRNN